MDGDLGCLQFGAIMNKAGMLNLLRHNYSFLLDIYQGIQSLGSRICIYSALMNFVKRFSKWLYQFILLLAMFAISSFSTFSSTFVVINLYHFGPSDGV